MRSPAQFTLAVGRSSNDFTCSPASVGFVLTDVWSAGYRLLHDLCNAKRNYDMLHHILHLSPCPLNWWNFSSPN